MTEPSSSTPLPARPDFDQLKKQAKERRASGACASLAEAQFLIATQYGFASWAALKTAVQQITLKRCLEENDSAGARALLTSSRALVNLPFDDGTTPLHVAAGKNRPEMVEVLLTFGASAHARLAGSGHSALSWALTCWAYDAAERLVALGIAPDLFCAAGLGHLDAVRGFWTNGRLERRPSSTGSSRYDDAGERLPCPPPNDVDQLSDALYIACRCDRLEVARWLLDHGADPNWRGYAGATCLAWAEFSGNAELCALLRARGGSDDIVDRLFLSTPKVFAVMVLAGWGFFNKLLARLSADGSIVTFRGGRGTPLHAAAAGGHTGIVKLLLHFGADRLATDEEGRTPGEVAVAKGHAAVASLLGPPLGSDPG
jgi:ankyrin repeat protein